jgi:CRP-like cAMP-binding protein
METESEQEKNLSDVSLQLGEGVRLIDRGDGSFLCVAPSGQSRVILEQKEAELAAACDGKTLSEIAIQFYERDKFVPFGLLVTLVRRLARQQLLVKYRQINRLVGVDKQRKSFKRRLFEIDLVRSQRAKVKIVRSAAENTNNDFSSVGLIGAFILLLFGVALGWSQRPEFSGVLLPAGDPFLGLIAGYGALSFLVTARYMVLAAVGYLSGGAIYPWRLRLYMGILGLDVGSLAVEHCHKNKRSLGWLLALCVPLVVIMASWFVKFFFLDGHFLINELVNLLQTISWFFLLLEMCPYLPTSAGRLYQTVGERSERDAGGLSYLRRKMLKRTFLGDFFQGERILLLWVTLAFLWSTLAFTGAFELNKKNIGPLIISLSEADTIGLWAVVIQIISLTALVVSVTIGFMVLLGSFVWGVRGAFFGERQLKPADPLKRNEVERLLKETPIFHQCSDDEIHRLVDRMSTVAFSPGGKIIKQGEPGEKFFILASGFADVSVENESGMDNVVARLGPGDTFGEQALLSDMPRTATVVGKSNGTVLALPRDGFEEIVQEKSIVTVEKLVQGASLLHNSPFFQDLEPDAVEQLLRHLEQVAFESGQTVFSKGDDGDYFYIVMEGEFLVLNGEGEAVAVLGPGDPFGEIALIANVSRTATIRAQTKGRVFRCSRDQFFSFFLAHLDYGVRIEELGASRFNEGDSN